MFMMMKVMMAFIIIIICSSSPSFMFIVALLFRVLFKCAIGPDWKCSGCVVLIVMITAGDAEDA